MPKKIKLFFHERDQGHDLALYSSFLYILCAALIGKDNLTIVFFLFLVFLTSIFYHSYPRNAYFRIADWLASISFISFLLTLIYQDYLDLSNYFGIFLLFFLLAATSFIVSLFASREKNNFVYNASHALWHLSSVILICIIYFAG